MTFSRRLRAHQPRPGKYGDTMTRPTALLEFAIKGIESDEDLAIELRRSYLHIAPVRLLESPSVKRPELPEKVLTIVVKLHKEYWLDSAEGALATWQDLLIPWLKAKLYKVEKNIIAYNETALEENLAQIHFDRIGLLLGPVCFFFKTASDGSFPAILEALEHYRSSLNEGIFGETPICRVEIPPSAESEEPAGETDGSQQWELVYNDGSSRLFTCASTAQEPND